MANAHFSKDQRTEAIRLWRELKLPRRLIAERVGCHRETVARWLYDAFPEAFPMPASIQRVRRGPEVDAAKERAKERRANRQKIAAHRAEREAQK